MTYLLIVLSYVLGSIPSSYIIGKVFHDIDLREHGSGNLGATNAFRVLGARSAIPVISVDVLKGFIPIVLFPTIASVGFGWILAFGAAAIVGHMFSVWVAFSGGKGMATAAGVFLGIAPWAVLVGLIVWCGVTFSTGYVSLGSIVTAFALPFLVAFTPHQGGLTLVWFSVAIGSFVIWAHRGNVKRLFRGEEHRFGPRSRGVSENGEEPESVA